VTLAACGDRKASEPARKSALETGIARDLTAKLGTPVTASCTALMGIARCDAALADGTKIPIEVKSEGKEWAWRVVGLVVETAPIVTYLDATLADMKTGQRASCGPRAVFVEPGGRIACKLSGGGIAFVRVDANGNTSLELDIDPAAATARSEPITPDRARQLTTISHALENVEGESDGEEELPADGGVPSP
jgi:hypothetical protein